jgi:hypothetical protein
VATAWVAGQYPLATDVPAAAYAAVYAADRATTTAAAYAAARAATDAAVAAASVAVPAAVAARAGAYDAAAAAIAADLAAAAAAADAKIIDNGASASALALRPLWPTETPRWARDAWQRLEEALLKENQDWHVWTEWYRARLEGMPVYDPLEVARVSIEDEIWKKGPRAVNAEIARLTDEHRRVPDSPVLNDALQKKPLGVPPQRPAAVQPVWRDHRLTLPAQPAAQDLSEAELIAALAGLSDDLRELADDLSGEANIDTRFLSYIRRFADRIPPALPSQYELFRLGHLEGVFRAYAKVVDSEWPEFLSARYHAVALQCERTMRQSPLWREFKRNAADTTLTVGQIAAATPLATATANALQEDEARDFVDGPVPAALEELTQTLRQVQDAADVPLDAIAAENELLAADLIESVNNVLKPIAEAALKAAVAAGKALGDTGKTLAEVGQVYAAGVGEGMRKAAKEEGPKDGEKAFKWLRRLAIAGAAGAGAAGAGAFADLGQLIAKFPQAFEWLERVLHLIR